MNINIDLKMDAGAKEAVTVIACCAVLIVACISIAVTLVM